MADPHGEYQVDFDVDFGGGGDRRLDPLIDSLRTATLRDKATAVLAGYHHLDHEEAGLLLHLLADCLGCPVDALCAELVRAGAARDLSRFRLAD